MEADSWHASVDIKQVKQNHSIGNGTGKTRRLAEIRIDNFPVVLNQSISSSNNTSTLWIRLRLYRHENLFADEHVIDLIQAHMPTELLTPDAWNCLHYGTTHPYVLYMIGCDQMHDGLLIVDNYLFTIRPCQSIANDRNQTTSYQVKSIALNTKLKFLIDDNGRYNAGSTSDLVNMNQTRQTTTSYTPLNINMKIDKSLVYTARSRSDLFTKFLMHLNIVETQLNKKFKLKLKINAIDFVDLKTNEDKRLDAILAEIKFKTRAKRNQIDIYYALHMDDHDGYKRNMNTQPTSTCLHNIDILLRFDDHRDMPSTANLLLHLIASDLVVTSSNGTTMNECLTKLRNHLASEDECHRINTACMWQLHTTGHQSSRCGNGIVDEDEDCDCGTDRLLCNTDCCDWQTCKFRHASVQCAHGDCCVDCRYRPVGTVCRPRANQFCDVDETCSGSSAECPDDVYIHDGTTCPIIQYNHNGTCYSGQCVSKDMQCKSIWNSESQASDASCYTNYNTIGFQMGNCGGKKRIVNDEMKVDYRACQMADVQCGLLNCQSGASEPVMHVDTFFKSTTSIKAVQYECKSISGQSAVYVSDGASCAADKICVGRKCVSKPITKCPSSVVNSRLCSGHGKCLSHGKCFCDSMWTGTKCDYYLSNSIEYNRTTSMAIDHPKINSMQLYSVMAGVIVGLFIVFLGLLLFYRRRSTQKSKRYVDHAIKREARPQSLPFANPFNNTQLSVKSISTDNLSITKLNNAIKQLSRQPDKSILKKTTNQAENDDEDDEVSHYVEINANLNDTITNTNLNRKCTLRHSRVRHQLARQSQSMSLSTSSSSNSSLLSVAEGSNIQSNRNKCALLADAQIMVHTMPKPDDDEDDQITSSQMIINAPVISDFSKVQDYLNELNLLSKQNGFSVYTKKKIESESADNFVSDLLMSVNHTPLDHSLTNIDQIVQDADSHKAHVIAYHQYGHNTNTINTNSSESSGYASGSTLVYKYNANKRMMNDEIEHATSSHESVRFDQTSKYVDTKRHSYLLATSASNDLTP